MKKLSRHNKSIIYNCGCGKAYSYKSSLRKHIKSKHDSKPPNGTYLA